MWRIARSRGRRIVNLKPPPGQNSPHLPTRTNDRPRSHAVYSRPRGRGPDGRRWVVLRRAATAKVELSKRFSRHRIDPFLRRELRGVDGTILDLGAGLRPFADLIPGR